MKATSVWTSVAQLEINDSAPLTEKLHKECLFYFYLLSDGLWMVCRCENGSRTAFRLAFAGSDSLALNTLTEESDTIKFSLEGLSASFEVIVEFPESTESIIHFTTRMTPRFTMLIPFWPRDIVPLTQTARAGGTTGKVHTQQVGTRSGAMFFSITNPKPSSVFYFQNLSSLAEYCEDTKTSSGELVGGTWPEVGFQLPICEENPIQDGKSYVVSDAYILFSNNVPENNLQVTLDYLNYLAAVYRLLPLPETLYHDWPLTVEQGLSGLVDHKGCWTHAAGHDYLNAYVSDYKTPPEIMVQMAVMMPLIEYQEWKGEPHPVVETLKDGLPAFYDEELKTLVRWLPAKEDDLDNSEEQKQKRVMDSWYLHHPLMNLARMAKRGHKKAEDLLLSSIDYAIKVAHHFEYDWPVFYRMDSLEVEKAETKPGAGGEKDVPGSYAHLMLEVWDLTGDIRYLKEAKKAAKKLTDLGFDIFYQANNTAFAAGAMLRLYKETKEQIYLDLSYACIASIMKNVQLWDCNYGNGKHYPTFFAVFPLNDAPYTAAYEEHEVYAALDSYLKEAADVEILPSVKLLCSEFIKYAIGRIPYYYPPKLPADILSEEVKTGEVDPSLWIPLEDIHDGWEASGEVGQEVYGAGIGLGLIPRQYYKVDEGLTVFVEYPISRFRRSSDSLTFFVHGNPGLTCRLLIIYDSKSTTRPEVRMSETGRKWSAVKSSGKNEFGHEFQIKGDHRVKIIF